VDSDQGIFVDFSALQNGAFFHNSDHISGKLENLITDVSFNREVLVKFWNTSRVRIWNFSPNPWA